MEARKTRSGRRFDTSADNTASSTSNDGVKGRGKKSSPASKPAPKNTKTKTTTKRKAKRKRKEKVDIIPMEEDETAIPTMEGPRPLSEKETREAVIRWLDHPDSSDGSRQYSVPPLPSSMMYGVHLPRAEAFLPNELGRYWRISELLRDACHAVRIEEQKKKEKKGQPGGEEGEEDIPDRRRGISDFMQLCFRTIIFCGEGGIRSAHQAGQDTEENSSLPPVDRLRLMEEVDVSGLCFIDILRFGSTVPYMGQVEYDDIYGLLCLGDDGTNDFRDSFPLMCETAWFKALRFQYKCFHQNIPLGEISENDKEFQHDIEQNEIQRGRDPKVGFLCSGENYFQETQLPHQLKWWTLWLAYHPDADEFRRHKFTLKSLCAEVLLNELIPVENSSYGEGRPPPLKRRRAGEDPLEEILHGRSIGEDLRQYLLGMLEETNSPHRCPMCGKIVAHWNVHAHNEKILLHWGCSGYGALPLVPYSEDGKHFLQHWKESLAAVIPAPVLARRQG